MLLSIEDKQINFNNQSKKVICLITNEFKELVDDKWIWIYLFCLLNILFIIFFPQFFSHARQKHSMCSGGKGGVAYFLYIHKSNPFLFDI